MNSTNSTNPLLLDVENLHTYFYTDDGIVRAVDGISFSVDYGCTLGIVGESGCGKSVACLSIMRLIAAPQGKIVKGAIRFRGEDLSKISIDEMRKIRGNEISIIFQEPMTSLNPLFTIGEQLIEVIILHQKLPRYKAWNKGIKMLDLVGIPAATQRMKDYPHQLSGGMRQRVMIAMALSCHPYLLIADEPTTALDVTIQAQILELLKDLQAEFNMAIIMITHDLGVIAEIADEVAIMYAGQIVEYAKADYIFNAPLHPYTKGLLASIPRLDQKQIRLKSIKGIVPSLKEKIKGCRFASRCEYKMESCEQTMPELRTIQSAHLVRCHIAEQV